MFGYVRTLEIRGEHYLFAVDVTSALGFSFTDNAVETYLDDDDIILAEYNGWYGTCYCTVITPYAVCCLAEHSKSEKAKEFKRWVFDEVLPILRGKHFNNDINEADIRRKVEAIHVAKETFGLSNADILGLFNHLFRELDMPQLSYDEIETAQNNKPSVAIPIEELVECLNGYGRMASVKSVMKRLRFFGFLKSNNKPSEKSVAMGLFVPVTRILRNSKLEQYEKCDVYLSEYGYDFFRVGFMTDNL